MQFLVSAPPRASWLRRSAPKTKVKSTPLLRSESWCCPPMELPLMPYDAKVSPAMTRMPSEDETVSPHAWRGVKTQPGGSLLLGTDSAPNLPFPRCGAACACPPRMARIGNRLLLMSG